MKHLVGGFGLRLPTVLVSLLMVVIGFCSVGSCFSVSFKTDFGLRRPWQGKYFGFGEAKAKGDQLSLSSCSFSLPFAKHSFFLGCNTLFLKLILPSSVPDSPWIGCHSCFPRLSRRLSVSFGGSEL